MEVWNGDAILIDAIPAEMLLDISALRNFLNGEMTHQINVALDAHVVEQIVAASPPATSTGDLFVESVRYAVGDMRAVGANPTLLALDPVDAAALDLEEQPAERCRGSRSPDLVLGRNGRHRGPGMFQGVGTCGAGNQFGAISGDMQARSRAGQTSVPHMTGTGRDFGFQRSREPRARSNRTGSPAGAPFDNVAALLPAGACVAVIAVTIYRLHVVPRRHVPGPC